MAVVHAESAAITSSGTSKRHQAWPLVAHKSVICEVQLRSLHYA